MMINFHTHTVSSNNGISVQSLKSTELSKLKENGLFTIGVHPWESDRDDVDSVLNEIINLTSRPEVIGIGEIGLDRLQGASLEKQIEVFVKQICIVDQIKKPLIIHCVKAWAELLEIKKMTHSVVPWAVHGFRGNPDLAKQLVSSGFYLSFGAPLADPAPSLAEALTYTPLDRLFLETDESPVSIGEVYYAASDILNISVDDLVEQINANFATFFGRKPM